MRVSLQLRVLAMGAQVPSPADLLVHAVEHVRDGVLLVLQQVHLVAPAAVRPESKGC